VPAAAATVQGIATRGAETAVVPRDPDWASPDHDRCCTQVVYRRIWWGS
jgi:hypothetical protein